jgi:hypothetical protein
LIITIEVHLNERLSEEAANVPERLHLTSEVVIDEDERLRQGLPEAHVDYI